MSEQALKLTLHFGERDRHAGRFLADAVLDLFVQERIAAGILIRGAEGFGVKHRLHTDRLLTLSEDLPLVAVAVDRIDRVQALFHRIEPMLEAGLLTMERARLLGAPPNAAELEGLGEAAKLTIYVGRDLRVGGRPVHQEAVEILSRCGVDGATVLLGVDGTVRGRRRRAAFFARNESVPAMVISIGHIRSLALAARELGSLPGRPLMTLERANVLKRDGNTVGTLPVSSAGSERQRLTLYSSEQAHVGARPVHVEMVRRLRSAGASGAVALRGVWGYDGDHEPHGETFMTLRRRVPTLTAVIDEPVAVARWFSLVDAITSERGLLVSERIPAFLAKGPGIRDEGSSLPGAPGS